MARDLRIESSSDLVTQWYCMVQLDLPYTSWFISTQTVVKE